MNSVSLNLSMGGSFYRAQQNNEKVNKAVNQMLNRLETGEKYQFAYQNVAAVNEGAALSGAISANESATDRNKKYQQELDPLMKAQTEILDMLGEMKNISKKYSAMDNTTGAAADALVAQFEELQKAADELAGNISFNGKSLKAGLSGDININAANDTYAVATSAIDTSTITGITDMTNLDAIISSISEDSAKIGVVYNNVLGSSNDVMTTELNSMSQRYSNLLVADDNETSAMLTSLSARLDAINASKQYAAGYTGNSISLMNLLA